MMLMTTATMIATLMLQSSEMSFIGDASAVANATIPATITSMMVVTISIRTIISIIISVSRLFVGHWCVLTESCVLFIYIYTAALTN